MLKAGFSILIIALVAGSCKKNDSDPVPPPPVPDLYMNLAAGSSWQYELTNNTVPPATTAYTLMATNRDSAINGHTYHVFTNSGGTPNEYYWIDGHNYYNFRSLPATLGGTSVEYLYLKDNAAQGESWTQSFPVDVAGTPLGATLTNTITEKGISKTVNGTTYNDVIHVSTTISVSVAGIPLPAGAITSDIQSYYAGKVGLIAAVNKINIDFSGIQDSTNQSTELKSAVLK